MNNSNNVTTQSIPHLQPTDLARKWKRQHQSQTIEETTSIDSIHNTSNQSNTPKPEKHNASTKTTNPRHPLQLNSSPSISSNKQSTIYIQTALFDHPMDDHETKTEQPLHQQPTHQQLDTIQILSHTQTKQLILSARYEPNFDKKDIKKKQTNVNLSMRVLQQKNK